MSKYTQKALERRAQMGSDGKPLFNCAQSVSTIFAEDAGYDEAAAMSAATYFRGGMQMGSVCGAITGSLMALGLSGIDDAQVLNGFYNSIRQRTGGLMNCRELLKASAERGEDKMTHCNSMICACIDEIEALLRKKGVLQ